MLFNVVTCPQNFNKHTVQLSYIIMWMIITKELLYFGDNIKWLHLNTESACIMQKE